MARPKRDPSADKEKLRYGREWHKFRESNNLSQKFLSELIGVSRRTIQSVEAGGIIPQEATLAKFEQLRTKYEAEGKSGGRRKPKKTKTDKGEF